MASKISKFLSSYDAKMPADGVPATLLRRLDFLTPVAELQNTKPKRWSFTLNAAIVVSTVLVSSYAFYKLGETGSYVLL
ncbi:MAG: hypothetical protein NTV44_01790, partial [Firmicutes bacterium]|nr:hypothetical protein [Bacillota bacterium]